MKRTDIAVVGGGASGLMAARRAALFGRQVLLLEGNPRPGKKLLSTGNGRCNLTNLHVSPKRYRGDREGIARVLARVPADRILEEFSRIGLLCREEAEGRVYPRSLQAASVLRALWSASEEADVGLLCGFEAVSARAAQGGFLLRSAAGEEVFCKKLILACGGRAAPKLSRGGGYTLAKALGHSVTALSPALAPIKTSSRLPAALRGIRVRAAASLYAGEICLARESGEVLFGDGQLSGICVFDLSAHLREAPKGVPVSLGLDLLDGLSDGEVRDYFRALRENRPALSAREIFSGVLPERLGQAVAVARGIPAELPISGLSEEALMGALSAARDLRFPVTGVAGWDSAQVTQGGVPLSEVDPETMASRRHGGLYLTGELLDVDGDCGGFNLHWAWATGLLAGDAAGEVAP